MKASETLGAVKKLGRTAWSFEKTFVTPSQRISAFAEAIASSRDRIAGGTVVIANVIFTPYRLEPLLIRYGLSKRIAHDWSIEAENNAEVIDLLTAAFTDGIDFVFVARPRSFIIYADHDYYATFYASTKSNLNSVVEKLEEIGVRQVRDHRRKF